MKSYKMHKKAKKENKKAVSYTKFKAYDDAYNEFKTKEKKVFSNLQKIRERRCRDLDHVKCAKRDDQKALVKNNDN